MGAVVTTALFTYRPAFVAVVAVSAAYASYEVATVLRTVAGRRLPLTPLVAGTLVTYAAAYERGSQGLTAGLLLTGLALFAWRLLGGGAREQLGPDLAAALWVLGYVVLLAGFAVLLAVPPDGARRGTCFIATVVCSDVGGYAAGALFGRHPMAPLVSPKKSWEGFAGSCIACMMAGALLVGLLLHAAIGKGIVYGLAVAAAATIGDLGESLVKRDLGVKDMGRLLPGHGGLMDRMDSLLLAAPVAYLLLTAFSPPAA